METQLTDTEPSVADSTSLREAGGDTLGALVLDGNGQVVQVAALARGVEELPADLPSFGKLTQEVVADADTDLDKK